MSTVSFPAEESCGQVYAISNTGSAGRLLEPEHESSLRLLPDGGKRLLAGRAALATEAA
jgi:hypothetical protein